MSIASTSITPKPLRTKVIRSATATLIASGALAAAIAGTGAAAAADTEQTATTATVKASSKIGFAGEATGATAVFKYGKATAKDVYPLTGTIGLPGDLGTATVHLGPIGVDVKLAIVESGSLKGTATDGPDGIAIKASAPYRIKVVSATPTTISGSSATNLVGKTCQSLPIAANWSGTYYGAKNATPTSIGTVTADSTIGLFSGCGLLTPAVDAALTGRHITFAATLANPA